MLLILLTYFLILLATTVLCSAAGKLILAAAKIEKTSFFYSDFFIEQITGIVVCTLLYAIYKTSGDTIMTLVLLLLIFLYLEFRKTDSISSFSFAQRLSARFKMSYNKLPEVLFILVFYFAWQAFFITDFRGGVFLECNADLHSMSFITDSMNFSGIERMRADDVPATISTPANPYHYFELWFVALVSGFTTHLPLLIIKLILIPLFLLNLYCIILFLTQVLQIKSKLWIKGIAFTYLFLRLPIFIFLIGDTKSVKHNEIGFLMTGVSYEPLLYKTIHLEILTFLVLILFLLRKHLQAVICILIYVAICYTAMPVLIGSVLIYGFTGLVSKWLKLREDVWLKKWFKDVSSGSLYKMLLYTIVTVIFLGVFYKLNYFSNEYVSNLDDYTIGNVIKYYSNSAHIRENAGPFFLNLLQLLQIIVPLLLILYFIRKKNKQRTPVVESSMWLLWIGSAFLSLFSSYLFIFKYDYFVLFRITNIPFLTVVSVYVLLLMYKYWEGSLYWKFVPLIILFANAFYFMMYQVYGEQVRKTYLKSLYDSNYIHKVQDLLKETGPVGVSMFSEDSLTNSNIKQEYNVSYCFTSYNQRLSHGIYHLGFYLNYFEQNAVVHPITYTPPFSVGMKSKMETSDLLTKTDLINNTYYYTYYCENELKDKNLSENEKRAAFIKKVNAGYLIATAWAKVPPEIRQMISDSAVNKKTGERFYSLKY